MPERKWGSVRTESGWVSIPLGTSENPLTDDELAEAKRILAEADALSTFQVGGEGS